MKLHHRDCRVTHGHTGWQLHIRDESVAFTVGNYAIDGLMAVLGHPCCGKGLGRIPGTDVLWFRLLNAANGFYRHGRDVLRLPLTTEQARAIQPNVDEWEYVTIDGWDEDGELFFEDGRLTWVKCEWCGETLPAKGRASGAVLDEHACSEAPVPSATSPWEP